MIRIFSQSLNLSREDQHHLFRVLRIKPGEKVEIVVNEKELFLVEIGSNKILNRTVVNEDNYPNITLAQALPKGDKFSDILRMNTEIGVKKFIPVITERVENKREKRDRRESVVKSAAEQAKRNMIPKISPVMGLEELMRQEFDTKIVLWENEDKRIDSLSGNILVLVGPEGGFSENEIEQLKNADFVSASLGDYILRTEHAGFAAISKIL